MFDKKLPPGKMHVVLVSGHQLVEKIFPEDLAVISGDSQEHSGLFICWEGACC